LSARVLRASERERERAENFMIALRWALNLERGVAVLKMLAIGLEKWIPRE
jgi:hypothetical protein